MKKIDGRKARWFDCDWNNQSGMPNGCADCEVCKYFYFLDFAESVCSSSGTIERNIKLDYYTELKTIEEKQDWIFNNLKIKQ